MRRTSRNLGEQIDVLLRTGARIFHFDVGDGHFVEPITIGPDRAAGDLADRPRAGRRDRLPPDGRQPDPPLPADRARGRRQRHVPLRGGRRRARRRSRPRASTGCRSASRSTPRPSPRTSRRSPADADIVLCMSIHPGYSGQEFMDGGARAHRAPARGAARDDPRPGRRRRRQRQRPRGLRRGCDADRRGQRDLRPRGPAALVPPVGPSARVSYFERALELAERGRGKVEDHPLVGAVVVAGDEIVGEGWYEYARVDHARGRARSRRRASARAARRCT